MESNSFYITDTNIKIIFINDINSLLIDFFNTITSSDIKTYFDSQNVNINTNFNNWVIKNLSEKQINFLKSNIKLSVRCLKNLNRELNNKNFNLDYDLWKLCIFDNMFFNLPFTLLDVIFIPRSYIISSMEKEKTGLLDFLFDDQNQINKGFSKTLVHEKIHLLQRYNQDIWNKYITANTNWRIVNKPIYFNSSPINNNKIIYNPDTYYVKNVFAYLEPKSNIFYYGQMLLNSNKKIRNIWYQMVSSNDKINLYPIYNSITKYEHPYEELAYTMSDELINKINN